MPQEKLFELPYSTAGKTTIYGIVMQRSTGYYLDDATGAFAAAPADKFLAATEHAVMSGLYQISESRAEWSDGYYLCAWYDRTGASEDPTVDPLLGTTTLTVSSDVDVSSPSLATGYTYDDIKADALIDLKGSGKAAYGDTLMNKLVRDAVQIARKTVAQRCPEMIWTTKAISLLEDNAGPYDISVDFESVVKLLDEEDNEIETSFRGKYNVANRTMKPDGYWIEGYAPARIYVNATPDQAYAWTLYYIATIARQTDFTQDVPLPSFFREALTVWVVKFAGGIEEYNTVDEDAKISLMESLMSKILLTRAPAREISWSGVGF
jgi:hypothetical protein